jgi:hypothetical protein
MKERRYLSFLLRLWPVRQNGSETWRASLENPHNGKQRGFTCLEALMDFLREQTEEEEGKDSNNQIQEEN